MKKFDHLHLAQHASIITAAVPGPVSEQLISVQKEIEGNIVSYPVSMPIAIKRAKGAIIEDADGNLFIDFFSCAGVVNVGHSNPAVLEAVRKQQEDLIHALDFPTVNKMQYLRKILSKLPEDIRHEFKVSFCGPTGSDAIEAAIKLAKIKTGREGVIAFQGSYHGMTSGALSMTSNTRFRNKLKSLVPNVSFIPYGYCYRCPFNKKSSSCNLDCAAYLETVLENPHSGIDKPAAIILEPIQGEGGIITPQKGYLEKIIQIARKNDIVVIFDEIQCGFYRTGSFLSFLKQKNVFPDIVTMSKGLGGAGFPISAIIYNKSVEAWGPGDHIGTFRGNQVSIAAGLAAMNFVEDNNLESHVETLGIYLQSRLEELQEKLPVIGEVRGDGLFIGIEYVKDPVSKTPDPDIVQQIRQQCFAKGLLFEVGGHYNNVIRFLPPLVITKEIIDNAMDIFEEVNLQVAATQSVTVANTEAEVVY
jgi:diaminobutyrate-2-oxoglutarate transaminase